MDPLTHIVVGRAVVASVDADGPARHGVAAAAILGALAPDIDAGVAFLGWDRYVRIHEIGTHSAAGAFAMACLTAFVVRRVARFRGHHTRYAVLLASATAGAMSHLSLDLVSGARIRVGWPLIQQRVSLPLVAMADPWLIGICIAGLLALWPGGRRVRTVSRFMLATAIGFLCLKGALLGRALHSSPLATTPLMAIEARWASLTEWSIFERTSASLNAWTVNGRDRPAVVWMSQPLGPDAPLVQASRLLDTVRNFLSVHEFSFPIERRATDGRTEVLWSDARYCWPAAAGATAQPAWARQAGDDSIACGVWAGGVFGLDGHPLMQIVKVGAVVQSRPAPR